MNKIIPAKSSNYGPPGLVCVRAASRTKQESSLNTSGRWPPDKLIEECLRQHKTENSECKTRRVEDQGTLIKCATTDRESGKNHEALEKADPRDNAEAYALRFLPMIILLIVS